MKKLKYKLYNGLGKLQAVFIEKEGAELFQECFNNSLEEYYYQSHKPDTYQYDADPNRLFFFKQLDSTTQKEIRKRKDD